MHKIINFIVIALCFHTNQLISTNQPITLFCHGIVDNQSQAHRYQDFLQEPKQTFDFPDAQLPQAWNINSLIFNTCSLFGKQVNRDKMFMGYGQDIQTLKNQIHPENSYILYGLSRGGSTAISYLAQYNPNNVQALILDAAPADVVSSIDDFQYTLGYKFSPQRSTQEAIFNALFPAYPINSTPTVKDIANIQNKNIPIFIVHSHDDGRVHISSAWQLYVEFLQAGFTHIYLCQLMTGKHAHYMEESEKDLYLHALHSFYKKYNFMHNENIADFDVQTLQPTMQEISEKLLTYQKQLEKNYRIKKMQRQLACSTIVAVFLSGLALYLQKN